MKNIVCKIFVSIALFTCCLSLYHCGGDPDPGPSPDLLTITGFSPTSGQVGTSVTISGTKFSATPSSNTVKFNGTIATVSSATVNQLIATVPNGATSGTISVTVNGETITSSQSFTVSVPTPTPNPPTVSSFTPTSGSVGTSVEITGTNFSSAPAQNGVKFNGITAVVVSATTTKLTVTVPSGATTGKITVTVGSLTGSSSTNFTVTTPASAQWTAKANLAGNARAYAFGFSIGTKGYIGGGLNFITPYKDFWEYDATAGTWTQKANFTGPRYKAFSFSIESFGYVGTGVDEIGQEMTDFWRYNPATNQWTKVKDFGGSPMAGGFSFVIDGKGYAGDGGQMWQYDPSNNTWSAKKAYKGKGDSHVAAFALDTKGYAGTGYAVITGESVDFWEYNPSTNDWIQKANFPGAARGEAVGFALGTKGYIGLGNGDGTIEDIYEYNPSNNQWTKKDNINKAGGLYAAVSFVIGMKAYIGTGNDKNVNASKSFFEFDPSK